MSLHRLFLLCLLIASAGCTQQQAADLPSWALAPFVRPSPATPLISPDSTRTFTDPMTGNTVHWMQNAAFNPAAVVKDGKIIVLFRAEDFSGVDKIGAHTSRIGIAETTDGLTMTIRPEPVFYPDHDDQKEYDWPGGCEDPRVAVTEDGTYVMLYTSWNHEIPRLCVATSKDLLRWTKHGPAFKTALEGRFKDIPAKSASIVTALSGDKQVIKKVNGQYLMYWGEHFVNPAVSDDLINWTPMVDESGALLQTIAPRNGYFDSDLTECGPPALITDDGILLIYNGKNASGARGDTAYAANSYCAGQVLFDKNDPTKVLGRLSRPFLYPTEPFEKTGQYAAGTVFTQGMVFYNNKWFLYYGCADSRVGVAISE